MYSHHGHKNKGSLYIHKEKSWDNCYFVMNGSVLALYYHSSAHLLPKGNLKLFTNGQPVHYQQAISELCSFCLYISMQAEYTNFQSSSTYSQMLFFLPPFGQIGSDLDPTLLTLLLVMRKTKKKWGQQNT